MNDKASIFNGTCLCGEIKYEASGGKHTSYSCHCRDCQYMSGGNPNTAIYIPDAILTVKTCEPSSFSSKSDNGTNKTQYFCGKCGTPLYGESDMFPNSVVLKVGSLDTPVIFNSSMNVWVSSAQDWHYLDPDLPQYEKAPFGEDSENQ